MSLCAINMFALFIAAMAGGCVSNPNPPAETEELTAHEFMQKIATTADAQLVDVRTPQEFQNGHIEHALNLDWNNPEFDRQLAALDKAKPVLVYCLSGGRSGKAADKMRREGFEKVYELPGGMMEWRAENLPEITKRTASNGMTLAQYEAALNSDKMVLVDFYADWCAPCRKMKPYLEKIATERADKVTLLRIDADENPELCKALGVAALPVLKLYKTNTLLWEGNGLIDESTIRKQLDQAI